MAQKLTILKRELGERVKRLSGEKNISLSALETQVGYSLGMITRWTNASDDENFEIFSKLATIASILEVSVDELLGVAESKTRASLTEEANLISCMTASTRASKLKWAETDWKSIEGLSQLSEPEEHTLIGLWSAERERLRFFLAAYCDDLDDEEEPMYFRLYALAGHGVLPQPIQVETTALQALYMSIQLQAVCQSLINDTVE